MVIRWFCGLCCGVVGSEGDSKVSVFKQVGDSAYVWGGGKCEGCPLWAVSSLRICNDARTNTHQ